MSGAESVTTMATASPVYGLENYLVLPDHTMDERIAAAGNFSAAKRSFLATIISAMK